MEIYSKQKPTTLSLKWRVGKCAKLIPEDNCYKDKFTPGNGAKILKKI